MKVLEFTNYCSKKALENRIMKIVIVVLLFLCVLLAVKPKQAVVPFSNYLNFSFLKYNYIPDDYYKTLNIPIEYYSPLMDKQKLIDTVKRQRLYSYFRPRSMKRTSSGVWICGFRRLWTDYPKLSILRQGRFCAFYTNINGKLYVSKEVWK